MAYSGLPEAVYGYQATTLGIQAERGHISRRSSQDGGRPGLINWSTVTATSMYVHL